MASFCPAGSSPGVPDTLILLVDSKGGVKLSSAPNYTVTQTVSVGIFCKNLIAIFKLHTDGTPGTDVRTNILCTTSND